MLGQLPPDCRAFVSLNLPLTRRGGKVAMALALSDQPDHADRLARLVSVDMAPNRGKISDEFASYIDAFRAVQQAIDAGEVSSKSDADKVLERWEPVHVNLRDALTA